MSDSELARVLEGLLAAPQAALPGELLQPPPVAPAAAVSRGFESRVQQPAAAAPAPAPRLPQSVLPPFSAPWQQQEQGAAQAGSSSIKTEPAGGIGGDPNARWGSQAGGSSGSSGRGDASSAGTPATSGPSSTGSGPDISGHGQEEEGDATGGLLQQFQQALEAAKQQRAQGLPLGPQGGAATRTGGTGATASGLAAAAASAAAGLLEDSAIVRLLLVGIVVPLALISAYGQLSRWLAGPAGTARTAGSTGKAGAPDGQGAPPAAGAAPAAASVESQAERAEQRQQVRAAVSWLPQLPYLGGGANREAREAAASSESGSRRRRSSSSNNGAAWPMAEQAGEADMDTSPEEQQPSVPQPFMPPPPPPFAFAPTRTSGGTTSSGDDGAGDSGGIGSSGGNEGSVLWRRRDVPDDAGTVSNGSGAQGVLWRRQELPDDHAVATPAPSSDSTATVSNAAASAPAAAHLPAADAEEDLWRMPLEQLQALSAADLRRPTCATPQQAATPATAPQLTTAAAAAAAVAHASRATEPEVQAVPGAFTGPLAAAEQAVDELNGAGTGNGAGSSRRLSLRDDEERWRLLLDNAEP